MKIVSFKIKRLLNVFFNYITSPIKSYKTKRLQAKYQKNNILDFEKLTKCKHATTLELMRLTEKKSKIGDNDFKFLNEELEKGRMFLNSEKNKEVIKSPCFYDPEIVDIHNENLRNNSPSLAELKKIQKDRATNFLKKKF